MGIIEKTGIKPEWLELEITESLAMQDLEHTTSILSRIRDAGFGISLDDFGKGYSSLNYLEGTAHNESENRQNIHTRHIKQRQPGQDSKSTDIAGSQHGPDCDCRGEWKAAPSWDSC